MKEKKIALLGDSIFDNESYVIQGKSVIEQITQMEKKGWNAELLAVDGAITSDVSRQCAHVNKDISQLIVSCGGNNALGFLDVFANKVSSMLEAMELLTAIKKEFQISYQQMLASIKALNIDFAVCTIYDSSPEIGETLLTALSFFNDVIFREAFKLALPVLDFRLIFNHPSDYSAISPIEPSEIGGGKVARSIAYFVENHDFRTKNSMIYS